MKCLPIVRILIMGFDPRKECMNPLAKRFRVPLILCGTLAACVPFSSVFNQPAAAQTPALSTWKVINSKETGVSILVPPGTIVTPKTIDNKKTGGKMASLTLENSSDAAQYLAIAIRANPAGLKDLQAAAKPGKDPLDAIYDVMVKPSLDALIQKIKENPDKALLTRKPFSWQGLSGEEIEVKGTRASKNPNVVCKIRILRNKTSLYFLMAGEDTNTAAANERIRRFLASFALAPDAPLNGGANAPAIAAASKDSPPSEPATAPDTPGTEPASTPAAKPLY